MKIDEVLQKMNQDELGSLIILKPENIAYVTGFKPSSISVLILKEDPLLLSSKLDLEEARQKSQIPVGEFKSLDELKKTLKKTIPGNGTNPGKIGVEHSMTVGTYHKLCEDFQIKITDIIESLRVVKSPKEIRKIKGAIRIAEDSFKDLDFSVSEDNLAAQLEYNMRSAGSPRPSFETIVASGPRSSLPHATTTSRRLESPIMIDWGALYQDYASDMTRTIIEKEEEEKIFSIILEAQQKAIDAIKPGVNASHIDKVARNVIEEYGYGDNFIHSTGHGVGLEVHEKPSLSYRSDEKLEKGMVVTVEPGIYIEGKFGMRIEDMVLVTNHRKVLTSKARKIFA
ncbi:MAG: aminopeptidase [Methanobacteriales archaeon HGW-Methanobacteriales-2]|nr:MAG: aminopeptidase [Methanobacteriales archaeon HGW-Methanobacteriales-2]